MPAPPPFIAYALVLIVVFNIHSGTTHVSASDSPSPLNLASALDSPSPLNLASALDSPSPLKLARIQKYLKKINKPAVKSFEIDGDIIDCVPIDKQPALDHPLLKDHKIQTVAPDMPIFQSDGNEPENYVLKIDGEEHKNYALRTDGEEPKNYALRRDLQVWSQTDHCPKGTVPIQRTTMEDVLRAKSLSQYAKKQYYMQTDEHEYAVTSVIDNNPQHYGAKATINLWNPYVQEQDEFSLSQLWVLAGSRSAKDLNSIEVGWQVFPGFYGDSKTRLFIYWTIDAHNETGCYNLKCPGFVQTNPQVIIGGPIAPVSTYNGVQYEMTLYVWKDQSNGNWWLYQNTVPVGYWPSALFTHLKAYSTRIDFGGEIINTRTNGQHTQTQMGSGRFAREGYQRASYFRNIEVVNSANNLYTPSLSSRATNARCYDIVVSSDKTWGSYFYYGGPGRNPSCP